jgi:hypothetical protein
MPLRRWRHKVILTPEHHRALKLLARSPGGARESLLQAYGCSAEVLQDLVRGRLAVQEEQPARVGERLTQVKCLRITKTGREQLG